MKTLRSMIILLILFILPLAVRVAFYYRGMYQPMPVIQPMISEISIPEKTEPIEFVDSFQESRAVVVFDFAHNNNFKEAELSVLLSRLSARGASPEYLMPGDALERKLRRAQGFVIISPKTLFSNDEIRQVKHFVQTGGKLLLITDPTRYETIYDEVGLPSDRKSDVAVMNMLSASFGLIFQDDFLYNMAHNAGTFRDIRLTDFTEMPLTRGLEEVIFFAAHSIVTNGETVIKSDAETRSSLTEKRGGLPVAALNTNRHVLGLSDLTCLTEPYSSQANNDQLISNIAEFLVTGQREYTLADFPYFFGDRVDLRYAGVEAVGGKVLSRAGLLQSAFEVVGKKLIPRRSDSAGNDILFIGLYDGTDYVQEYLVTRQISITLQAQTEITGTSSASDAGSTPPTATSEPTVERPGALTPETMAYYSDTLPTELVEENVPTETPEAPIKGAISVTDLGEFPMETVTLISLGQEVESKVMIVLAASESALAEALEILASGDLSQCLTGDEAALCPSVSLEVTADLTPSAEDFYLPPPDSEIPMTSTLEWIEPVEPPLLPD